MSSFCDNILSPKNYKVKPMTVRNAKGMILKAISNKIMPSLAVVFQLFSAVKFKTVFK
jgi:hypothetical protein